MGANHSSISPRPPPRKGTGSKSAAESVLEFRKNHEDLRSKECADGGNSSHQDRTSPTLPADGDVETHHPNGINGIGDGIANDSTSDAEPAIEKTPSELQEEERIAEEQLYRTRTKIVEEVEATEAAYVSGLLCMHEVFAIPLIAKQQQIGVKQRTIDEVFNYVDELIVIHMRLLHTIRHRLQEWRSFPRTSCIGDIFMKASPALKLYTEYVNRYSDSLECIEKLQKSNEAFNSFLLTAQENPRCRGLNLLSFLITPVQRLPRYVLLLSDLLKHTPANHPDHLDLSVALSGLQQVTRYVNEEKRKAEKYQQLMVLEAAFGDSLPIPLVSSERAIIYEAPLLLKIQGVLQRKYVECYGWVMSDMLLFAERINAIQGLLNRQQWRYKAYIQLDLPFKVTCLDEESKKFSVVTREEEVRLMPRQPEEAAAWTNALQQVKEGLLAKKNRNLEQHRVQRDAIGDTEEIDLESAPRSGTGAVPATSVTIHSLKSIIIGDGGNGGGTAGSAGTGGGAGQVDKEKGEKRGRSLSQKRQEKEDAAAGVGKDENTLTIDTRESKGGLGRRKTVPEVLKARRKYANQEAVRTLATFAVTVAIKRLQSEGFLHCECGPIPCPSEIPRNQYRPGYVSAFFGQKNTVAVKLFESINAAATQSCSFALTMFQLYFEQVLDPDFYLLFESDYSDILYGDNAKTGNSLTSYFRSSPIHGEELIAMFEPLIMYYLDQTGSYQCFEEATLHHTVVGGRTQQQAAVPISTSAAEEKESDLAGLASIKGPLIPSEPLPAVHVPPSSTDSIIASPSTSMAPSSDPSVPASTASDLQNPSNSLPPPLLLNKKEVVNTNFPSPPSSLLSKVSQPNILKMHGEIHHMRLQRHVAQQALNVIFELVEKVESRIRNTKSGKELFQALSKWGVTMEDIVPIVDIQRSMQMGKPS